MWNGPSTVAGVAAGSKRWFICTTSMERPSTSEARMNSSRFSSLIWPVRLSHWIAAIHSGSVSRTSRAKSWRCCTSPVSSSRVRSSWAVPHRCFASSVMLSSVTSCIGACLVVRRGRGRGSGSTGRLLRSTDRKMSLATGCRSSSASWPISPAVRASRAKPRSSSSGRPRSASAAPQTPAPLSGSVFPSTCGCIRPIASNSARCGPNCPSSRAISNSRGVRGSPSLCTWWPRPGTKSPASRWRRTTSSATASQPALVGGDGVQPLDHVVQEPAAVLGDAEEPRAAAEQPGRQRALHRVGCGQVGQPGDDRGRA